MPEPNSKPELRKHYRSLRDAIPPEDRAQRSDAILRLTYAIDRVEQAGSVFVYISAGSEVATHGLVLAMLEQGKTVAVPRVMPELGVMLPMVIHSPADLAPGRFGIPEPTTRDVFDASPELALVPGLAFTRTGIRLGQGGGYYDRYLAQHPATYKLGLCFNQQLADALPFDEHDIAMDEVITA